MRRIPPAWHIPLACLLGVIPVLLVAALRWSAGPGYSVEDYAQYLLHARALAAGRPFADTGLLGIPPMPPGLPLLLSGFIRAFGEHASAIRLLMLALSLGAFVAGSIYFMMYDDFRLGLGVLLLVGLAPAVVAFSSHVLTDLPFCLAIWTLLIVADRPGTWSWPRIAAVALLGLAAIAIREVGIALIPAAVVAAAFRWRELRWKGLVPPGTWVAVIALVVAVKGRPRFTQEFDWLQPEQLFPQVGRGLHTYRIAAAESLLYPFPWAALNDAWHVIGLLLLVVGLAGWCRGAAARLAPWFCAVYATMLVLLPFAEARYMWAVTPLLLFGVLRGVMVVAGWLAPASRRLEPNLAALVFAVVLSLAGVIRVLTSPPPGSFADRPTAQDLFTAVRRLDPDRTMRAAFVRPRILVLETGIRAVKTVASGVYQLDTWLDRYCITHLIAGAPGLGDKLDSLVQVEMAKRPGQFESIYANADFTIYHYAGLRPERAMVVTDERCREMARAAASVGASR